LEGEPEMQSRRELGSEPKREILGSDPHPSSGGRTEVVLRWRRLRGDPRGRPPEREGEILLRDDLGPPPRG